MTETPNLKLKKLGDNSIFSVEEIDKNMDIIDEEVGNIKIEKVNKSLRIIAGSGMTGGGDLSGDINLDVKRTSDPGGTSTTTCLTQAGGKAIKDAKLDKKTPNNKEAIRYYGGSSNGDGIAIGAGGLTVIGSGEYPYTKMENLGGDTPETEKTYIGSDGDIIFHSGANTFANKKEAKMESSGVFRNDNGFYCSGSYMNYFKELKAGKLHFGNNDWLSYDDGTNKLSLTADGSSHTVWTDNLAPKYHSTNGYQKLPSGLILQWGSTTITGTHTVTFPIAFPSVCRAVMTTDKGSGGGIENQKIQEVSKTNFKAISTYSSGDAIYWFAIGY